MQELRSQYCSFPQSKQEETKFICNKRNQMRNNVCQRGQEASFILKIKH
jgi:hypothetical protein